MQCSSHNFLASQALYGIMIAYPFMGEDQQIEKAQRVAKKMMQASKKPKKRRKRTEMIFR